MESRDIAYHDVKYSITLTVNPNPGYGNLSLSINREMIAGTGSFTVPMQFNSTTNGTILVQSLILNHIPGASNIDLPTQPILQFPHHKP